MVRRMKWTVSGLLFGVCLVGCAAGEAEHATAVPPVPAVVTRRDAEPRGPNCANGGAAIRSGADRNGNGVLDDDEIQHTDYVCDPTTAVLVRRDPIDPDATCPTGGTAVRTGIDGNGDGVLDDSEVQSTTEVCGPAEIWEGDFTAADWLDASKVAALQGVRVVAGTLAIDTVDSVTLPALELVLGGLDLRAGAAPIELRALHAVDAGVSVELMGDVAPSMAQLVLIEGDLLLDGTGGVGLPGTMIDAPALREIGGSVRIGTALQIDMTLPGVRTIGGDLIAGPEGHVKRIALPDLETVTGQVWIAWQSALLEVSLPVNQTIGGDVQIWASPVLARIELGTIAIGGALALASSPMLATLSLPRLQIVHSSPLGLAGVQIDSVGLAALELPALRQASRVFLEENPAMTAVRLPALTDATRLTFMENPMLASVSAPEVTALDALEISSFNDFSPTPALRALDFGKLATVSERILIIDAVLPDLSAFRNLTRLGALQLGHVEKLADLRSLTSLVELNGLDLDWIPSLTSLDGIEWVTELSGSLSLQADPALTSIVALRGVTRVGGWFVLTGDPALADVALPVLTEIGGSMQFLAMPAVPDLSGLSAVRSVGGDITFLDNALSDDQVAAFMHQIGR